MTLNRGGGLSLAFLASSKAPSRMRVAIPYLTYARSLHPSNRLDPLRVEKSRASCTLCHSKRLHSRRHFFDNVVAAVTPCNLQTCRQNKGLTLSRALDGVAQSA